MNLQSSRARRAILTLLCLSLFIGLRPSHGQTLQSFESGFQRPSTSTSTSGGSARSSYRSGDNDLSLGEELGAAFIEGLAQLLMEMSIEGGFYTLQVAGEREHGDPILPVFQLNAGVQRVRPQVAAYDYSFAVGYGMGAAGIRHTHFREDLDGKTDTLNLIQSHLFYRMAFHPRFEFALGLGGAWMRGETSESGLSFAAPVRFWPREYLGIEVRPAWVGFNGVTLTDVETSLLLRYRQVSVQLGYRWLEIEDSPADLSGWRAGLSWRF